MQRKAKATLKNQSRTAAAKKALSAFEAPKAWRPELLRRTLRDRRRRGRPWRCGSGFLVSPLFFGRGRRNESAEMFSTNWGKRQVRGRSASKPLEPRKQPTSNSAPERKVRTMIVAVEPVSKCAISYRLTLEPVVVLLDAELSAQPFEAGPQSYAEGQKPRPPQQ